MPNKGYKPILSIPLVNYLTWKKAAIQRFQAERFVFTVQIENQRHKIFQVVFSKADGSLYVTFPYFDLTDGIVSIITIPALTMTTEAHLEHGGKVTSKRVKYAHHPDGEVHFSQTRKVATSIRKNSLPLNRAEGHIFSIHIQGFSHFEEDLTNGDHPPKKKRMVLDFKFDQDVPQAIKFAAWWYKAETLINLNQGGFFGPKAHTQTPDGKIRSTFLIGPPQGWPMEKYILLVNCLQIDMIDRSGRPLLNFIGGFDGLKRVGDLSKPVSCLCVSYPASDYDELIRRIGTIDLSEDS